MIKFYTMEKNENYDYYVVENKNLLLIESFMFGLVSFILLSVNFFLIILAILSLYNIYKIYTQIKISQTNIYHSSLEYKIKNKLSIILYYFWLIDDIDQSEIKRKEFNIYKKNIIEKIKNDRSLTNMEYIIKDISNKNPTLSINNKKLKIFVDTKYNDYITKYYPSFVNELDRNLFTIKSNFSDNDNDHILNQNYDEILNKAFKKFGLPDTIIDENIIQTRYYQLIKMYHPDHNNVLSQGELQAKMCEINEARNIILKHIKNKK